MKIARYEICRTTPAIDASVAISSLGTAALISHCGITNATAWKRKKRSSVHDISRNPPRLQTTLTPYRERLMGELHHHRMANLVALLTSRPQVPARDFKSDTPCYVHTLVKYLSADDRKELTMPFARDHRPSCMRLVRGCQEKQDGCPCSIISESLAQVLPAQASKAAGLRHGLHAWPHFLQKQPYDRTICKKQPCN